METQTLYRGWLNDHIQLVVQDTEASKRLYKAVFAVLGIPAVGEGDDYIWYDELFISTAASGMALGELTTSG